MKMAGVNNDYQYVMINGGVQTAVAKVALMVLSVALIAGNAL